MISYGTMKGKTMYTSLFDDIYSTALVDSKLTKPTSEELRKAAKVLEEHAAKLDKPKLTNQQEAILKYAEDHSIRAIKIDGERCDHVRTTDGWLSDGKRGEACDDWEDFKEIYRFKTLYSYGYKLYSLDLVVHKDDFDDLVVSVEYK